MAVRAQPPIIAEGGNRDGLPSLCSTPSPHSTPAVQTEAQQQSAEMEAQHLSLLMAHGESLVELQDEREGLRSALESRQGRSSALATQLATAEELQFEVPPLL